MHMEGRVVEGEEGGTSYTPSKDFENFGHKNAIKHKNRGPPSQIFLQPQVPPQRNLKIIVHLCSPTAILNFQYDKPKTLKLGEI
jgi:hypothetical protein